MKVAEPVELDDAPQPVMITDVIITESRKRMARFVSMRLHLLLVLVMIGSALTVSAQYSAQYAEPINHGGFYLGPRIGIPFLLGLRGRYVAANDEKPVFYVDGDAATSVLISALSVGGGIYPLGNALYVGAKYHSLSTPLVEDPGASVGSYSFEIGASIALGDQKNWLILVDAGPIINPVADQISTATERDYLKVLPNITLSLVGRLF
ncbi:MAG: hypothetical protein RLZZ273_162 [Bacteroidota bacterium]